MRNLLGAFVALVLLTTGIGIVSADEASLLKDQVKLQVITVGPDREMPPGFFICGEGHLHILATVENRSTAPLGKITVAGKVYDEAGLLLGTATASTTIARLAPNERAEVNLEFLRVTGTKVQEVKRDELTVTEAALAN